MANYLRYALAMFCFAASVACLALWWRSGLFYQELQLPTVRPGIETHGNAFAGMLNLFASEDDSLMTWHYTSHLMPQRAALKLADPYEGRVFGLTKTGGTYWAFLPLWYPALIFALAGVGVIRFRRQFSIRSASICVSVVALLLGMVVAL
ncbi:hypothetical protein [Lacipirellula limnantheis]|uniref:Uncharacterized protein n=1 Tax=Lacipirellula limnantheis TaxID=2528024 RepID=A0A517U1N9_9BACT|nr:hypothetical protein [Lacipirellula limnantheis]QDT74518.1 hypothetical protein I41_37150 [Lacipirellula limnantheis]